MPFSTGIHRYFAVNDKSQLELNFPSNEYKFKGKQTVNTFSGGLDFNSEEIDWAFINLAKQSAIITYKSRNLNGRKPLHVVFLRWSVGKSCKYKGIDT